MPTICHGKAEKENDMTDRRVLRIAGSEARDFLQGLITNDVNRVDQGLVYAALLTPQGKFLADFFLAAEGDAVLLDIHAEQHDMLVQRLTMYKLRADVTIETTDLCVHRGTGEIPEDGLQDPRSAAMGWRAYRDHPQETDETDWDALRVAEMIPEYGAELSDDSFILEMGFERLNGVDFRKGCYVGQEVTARMKHKTELRKGLGRVEVQGEVEPGTDIETDGRKVGVLQTRAGDRALAYLRFDRVSDEMTAGNAGVRPENRAAK
jgi:folate-binding protein YgfZ